MDLTKKQQILYSLDVLERCAMTLERCGRDISSDAKQLRRVLKEGKLD